METSKIALDSCYNVLRQFLTPLPSIDFREIRGLDESNKYFEIPFWAYVFYFDDVTIVFWHYYDVIILNLVKFEQHFGNDC